VRPPVAASSEPAAHDAATLQFYADEARAYAAAGADGVSRHLKGFLERLAPGARILDLGCGGGRDSAAMLAAGFDVDAADGVEAMALEAQARLGRSVRVMRFDELEATAVYDGVWANASLLHAPRPALPDVLARVFRALKPGGLHLASFKAGQAEGRDRFGRYFNYVSADALETAYRRSAGWESLSIDRYTGGGYEGGDRPWLVVTARRPG